MTTPLPGERVEWIDRADPFHPRLRFGSVYSLRRHGGYWFAIVECEAPNGHPKVVVALGLLAPAPLGGVPGYPVEQEAAP